MKQHDAAYLDLILEPIRVCAKYKPKFGQGAKGNGLTLAQFQTLYQSDPFYSWFGLDNPMMYSAHKAAGGMTSVYRQIGIGCEKLFRTAVKDALGLAEADVTWSFLYNSAPQWENADVVSRRTCATRQNYRQSKACAFLISYEFQPTLPVWATL